MRLLQDYLFCEVQSHFVNLASTVRLLYLHSTCTATIVHLFIHSYIDSTLPSNQSNISVVCNKRNVLSHCGVILHLKLNIYIQKKKKNCRGFIMQSNPTQEVLYMSFSWATVRKYFGCEVRWIILGLNVAESPFIPCCTFPDKMIGN